MSMFDDVALGLGRTSVMESALEPELANDDFDSVEPLDDSVDSMDFMMEAAFNNELNMRNLDTAIMVQEYTHLRENGAEMVYEAGNISTIINKAKEFVLSIWRDIQKFLATQADKLSSKMDKMFIDRYKKDAAGQKGKAKGSSELLGYKKYENDAKTIFSGIEDCVDYVANHAVSDKADSDTYDDLEWETVQKVLIPKAFKNVGVDVSGKESFSDILDEYYEAFKNTKTADPEPVSADSAIETLSNIVSTKRAIKDAYAKSKKIIDKQIKGLKKYENSAKKFKVIPTSASSMIHKAVRTTNKLSSVLAKFNRIHCKVLNASKAYCKAVIINAAAAGQAKGAVKKESAKIGLIDGLEVL